MLAKNHRTLPEKQKCSAAATTIQHEQAMHRGALGQSGAVPELTLPGLKSNTECERCSHLLGNTDFLN